MVLHAAALGDDIDVTQGICGPLCANLLSEVCEVTTVTIDTNGPMPPLVQMLLVGHHPAALSYASSTVAAAHAAGVTLRCTRLPETATQADVETAIALANIDVGTHGVLLQLPLPPHLDAPHLLACIADDKDVDCLKESSVRRCLLRAEPSVSPCIATAVEEVLRALDLLKPPQASRRGPPPPGPCVILLGVPGLLAFPLELCLEAAGCRVSTVCDEEPSESARSALPRADVLLIGIRRPDVVAAQWVRSGCVILDLGLATMSAPAPAAAPGGRPRVTTILEEDCEDVGAEVVAISDGDAGGAADGAEGGGPGAGEAAHAAAAGACAADAAGGAGGGASAAAAADDAPVARDVLCLCCSDGLSTMTAALRMRNASHAALVQQGFLEQDKPPPPLPPSVVPPSGGLVNGASAMAAASASALKALNPFANAGTVPPPRPDWAA